MSRIVTTIVTLLGLLILPTHPFSRAAESAAALKRMKRARQAAAICADGQKHEPVRVQIGTVEAFIEVGKEISIPVRVKGVCDLQSFEFWLTYQSRVASLERIEPATFLAGEPPRETRFTGLVPGAMQQTVRGTRRPGEAGVNGIGTLARLFFKGRTPGASHIGLVRLHLRNSQGRELATEARSVRLTVVPREDRNRLRNPGLKLPGD